MSESELRELLAQGLEVVLSFDTNTIFGDRPGDPFLTLCDDINRLNQIWKPRIIRKVIAAPVYTEKLHDLRQRYRGYDHKRILAVLEDKKIDIEPLEPRHAEHVAEMLAAQYPEDDAWHAFKQRQCLSCVGLTHLAHEAKRTGKHCGATIDWLVAGHADAEGYVLVTSDRGEEFARVKRKTTLESAVKVVAELLATSGAAS